MNDNAGQRILLIGETEAVRLELQATLHRTELAILAFVVEAADHCSAGVEKVQDALRSGQPFSVIFIKGAGSDNVAAVSALRDADPRAEFVLYAPGSDVGGPGIADRLLKFGAAFDPAELSQLAITLSEKWALHRQANRRNLDTDGLFDQPDTAFHRAALHDPLTGLANRALLCDRIQQAIARRSRNPDYHFAVLLLDFDRFRAINDDLGREVGDELLLSISARLSETLRVSDSICRDDLSTTARHGGDEFAVLVEDLKSAGDASVIAERLLYTLSRPYELHGHRVTSSVSIGATTSGLSYHHADEMLRDAAAAMQQAKSAGKGTYVVFNSQLHKASAA